MNKLYIGARVRITHINTAYGSQKDLIVEQSVIGSWRTKLGYYINKEGKTISGTEGILAIVELLNPIKRYKYKYKRK